MSIFFNRLYFDPSTISGGVSVTTPKVIGFLRQIIVKADTASTVFDVLINDGSSLDLFSREDVDGELNELLTLPVQSALRITVSGATADEAFKIYLAIQERSN